MSETLNTAERKRLLTLVYERYERDRSELNLKPLSDDEKTNARFPIYDSKNHGWNTKNKPGQFVAPEDTIMKLMMDDVKVREHVESYKQGKAPSAWLYPNPYNHLYRKPGNGYTFKKPEGLKMYLLYVGLANVEALRAQTLASAESSEPATTASPELPAPSTTLPAPPPLPIRNARRWWLGALLLAALLGALAYWWYATRPVLECQAYFWEASDQPESPDSIWSEAKFRFRNLGNGCYSVEADSLFKYNRDQICQGEGDLVDSVLQVSLEQRINRKNYDAYLLIYFKTTTPDGFVQDLFWGHLLAYSGSLRNRVTSRPIVFVPTELATPQKRQQARNFLQKLRQDSSWWRLERDSIRVY